MNLKKIGSALTAISMIASMATYVPFSASAAGHTHEDSKIADYADAIGTYSGTLYGSNVNYSLVVTKKASVTGTTGLSESDVTGVLTISSADENYTIPESDIAGEGFLDLIAYGEDDLGIKDVIDFTDKIVIEGSAAAYKTNAFVDVESATEFEISCLASQGVVAAADGVGTGNVTTTHNYAANVGKKTHTCSDCGTLSKEYDVHEFKAASTTAKVHTCDCGMTSEDYKAEDLASPSSDDTNYRKIHSFAEASHKCSLCGLDDAKKHVPVYDRTATAHTIKCSTEGCKMTLADAVGHTWTVFDGVNKPAGYTGEITNTDNDDYKDITTYDNNTIIVAGQTIKAHSHYCSVCGYVAGDLKEDTGHNYTNIYVSKQDTDGNWKMVITPVASNGLVCSCGARIATGHTHSFDKKNGYHMCDCGITENSGHAFNYVFTGTGSYTVNGLTGYDYDPTKGVKCGCGAVRTDSPHDSCISTIKTNTGTLKQDSLDKSYAVGKQHYCSCGKLITKAGGTTPKHDYVLDTKKNRHVCWCGAVNENGHDYNRNIVVVANTTEVGALESPVTYATSIAGVDSNTGVLCECGAVKESHKTHDFTKADMCDKVNHVHYCSCGASSTDESVHNFVNNVCTRCGAYVEHAHDRGSACKCTVCGEWYHDWAIATVKGAEVHQCQICGRTKSSSDLDATAEGAHIYDVVGDKHICACGKIAEGEDHGHKYVEGECKCILCDYENHNATIYNSVAHSHECTVCSKVFSNGEYCDFGLPNRDDGWDDKCNNCGFVNPMHRTHAVKTLGVQENGSDTCYCGASIAYNWVPDGATTHKNANVKQTITVDAQTGIETVSNEENASDLTKKAHSYTNGFCVCGAVDPTKIAAAKTANSNMLEYAKNYSTSYLVTLKEAIDDVVAYDPTTWNQKGYKSAKTAEEQAEFTNALTTFNTVFAKMENNKASAGYKMIAVGAGGTVYDDAQAKKTIIAQVGTEVTLTAKAKPGYTFAGWYVSDEENAALFASDATVSPYTVKVNNGVTNVYAKFKKNDTISFNIPGKVVVAYDNKKEVMDNAGTYDFVEGSEVTLYVCKGANAFGTNVNVIGLLNGWNQICAWDKDTNGAVKVTTLDLSDDNDTKDYYSYTFTVVKNMPTRFAIEAYTTTTGNGAGANKAYIVFKNDSQVLVAKNVNKTDTTFDASAIKPNDPVKNGHTFKGWAKSEAPTVVTRLKELTGDTVLVPVFEVIPGYKLTIGTGGRLATADLVKQNNGDGFEYGDVVTLTAEPMVKGKYFSGWYVGNTLYSQKKDCSYIVTGNATLTPKYEGDSELKVETISSLTVGDRYTTSTGQAFAAQAKWEGASDVTVVDAGFVFSFSGVTGESLKIENADGSSVYKMSSNNIAASGTYDFTFGLSTKTGKDKATVNLKSFVTYTDASGNTHTVYSDESVVKPLA